MIFRKITIENFKSIGPNPITVNLDFNNTTLLLGSNGSGKTTTFEAIVWCIYGVTKLKADNVVNKFVGEGTKVELLFSERGKDYIITRYRKHKVHKNNVYIFENGENISLKNQADTQELIQKIVGIDSRAFTSSIVLSSETYKQFLRETNSVRLQIFESVFSLRELNDFKKLTLQKIKDIQSKLNEKNSELVSVKSYNESDTAALKAYKSNYQHTLSEVDSRIADYRSIIARNTDALRDSADFDYDAEMARATEYCVLLNAYENSKNELERDKKNLASLKGDIDSLKETISGYEKIMSEFSVQILKNELFKTNQFEENNKKAVEFKNDITKILSEIKVESEKISHCRDVIRLYESKSKDLNIKLNGIKENICPTCGHHMDSLKTEELKSEYLKMISDNDEMIRNAESDISSYESLISEHNSEKSSIENELSRLDLTPPKYSVQDIKFYAQRLSEATKNIDSKKSLLSEKEIGLSELTNKINNFSLTAPEYNGYTIEQLNKKKESTIKLRTEIESAKQQIELAEKMKETAFDREYVQKIMNSIKERNSIIENLNSEMISLRREIAIYNVLDEVFSNGENGFKKYFINKTISMFNEKINTFLPFFFNDEIEIKFDKNLNDYITFRGKETDFDELSSGEKTRAELCVIFSLYFMVQSLFGCGTNLLAVDELLDRGLDEQGIKAAKSILDDISKTASVFVVTHRDDLKEMFNSVITVYKDGDGFTKIK